MSEGAFILVVEDDPAQVALFRRAARDAGLPWPVEACPSGEAALERLGAAVARAERGAPGLPALLVVDIGLPGMSGLDLLAELQRHPALSGVPVAVWTSSRRPEDREASQRLGARAYHVKPASFGALVPLVRALSALLPDAPPEPVQVS